MCVVFFCMLLLRTMEEEEISEMAAAWIEGDLVTRKRAIILALNEEQAEERKKVLRVVRKERVGPSRPNMVSAQRKSSRMHWDCWT